MNEVFDSILQIELDDMKAGILTKTKAQEDKIRASTLRDLFHLDVTDLLNKHLTQEFTEPEHWLTFEEFGEFLVDSASVTTILTNYGNLSVEKRTELRFHQFATQLLANVGCRRNVQDLVRRMEPKEQDDLLTAIQSFTTKKGNVK